MKRSDLKATAAHQAAVLAELSRMANAILQLGAAAAKPVVIVDQDQVSRDDRDRDNGRLQVKVRELEGKLTNADEMVAKLLARAETAEAALKAAQVGDEPSAEERKRFLAMIDDQAKRADVAETELVEVRLDLNNAQAEHVAALAHIETLEGTVGSLRADLTKAAADRDEWKASVTRLAEVNRDLLARAQLAESSLGGVQVELASAQKKLQVYGADTTSIVAENGRLQGEIDRLKAELAAARTPKSDIVVTPELVVTPAQADRSSKLKAAVKAHEQQQTANQVRAYGQYVTRLAGQSLTAQEIARRVNRELGLSASALTYHDVKRMCAFLGIQVAD
jgi:chromosome segregation ATPase